MRLPVLLIALSAFSAGTVYAAEPLDGVAAVVNKDVITFAEVRKVTSQAEAKAAQQLSGDELRAAVAKLRLSAINTLVEKKRAEMRSDKEK